MGPLAELKQKRAAAIEEAEALIAKADTEERALTEEEAKKVDELTARAADLAKDIERRQKVAAGKRSIEMVPGGAPRPDPNDDPNIGMDEDDIRSYSLVRAIRAASRNDWSDAGLEREASEAVAERMGKTPNGFFVPFDVLNAEQRREQRDLVVGTATAGGDLVATDLLAQSFIDLLRNKMVVRQAGAQVLAGLVGDIAIPRQTGGATGYWVAESGAPTESQQAVDQAAMSPKTVGAFTDISRKLLKQSSLDVERFVRNDLTTVLQLAVDLAALEGDSSGGSNEPDGVVNQTGVTLETTAADAGNGGAAAFSDIVKLETDVAAANADVGALAYITSAKVRGKLKTTEKVSGYPQFIWGDGQEPLNGYRGLVTNQVPSNLTKGSGTNLSELFFGNWADLIIGMWGTIDILVDPYTGGTAGTVRVIALQDVDIAIRHAASFAVCQYLTT